VNGAATGVKPRGRREFFGPPRDFMRRRVYGFPRLTNRHRSAFPSTDFFAELTRGMGGLTIRASPRDSARNSVRRRVRERNGRASLSRARSLRFYARHREGKRWVSGKGCLSQREESFMGDYGTHRGARRGWRRDFIPPLSEGNKCRGTFDQLLTCTPHAAARWMRPADFSSEICISSPEMITKLYYRITSRPPREARLAPRRRKYISHPSFVQL